jgi:hypothetical protein
MSALSATHAYFGESELDHAPRPSRAPQRFGQFSKEIAHAH